MVMNQTTNNKPLTLSHLKKGEKGIVKHINIEQVPLKLIELGCFVGSEIMIIQKASFNDPIYIRINNTYLSIRKDIASLIEIEKL